MTFFIQSTSQTQKQVLPGAYSATSSISVTDESGGAEVLVVSSSPRYVILNVTEGECFLHVGGTPTTSDYSMPLVKGQSIIDWPLVNNTLTAICSTGKTAKILVQTAPFQAIDVA